MQDSILRTLTKAYNFACHAFRFGKPISKGYTFVPHDKPFDPLNVEYDCFSKEHLDTLDAVIDCLQASDVVGALQSKNVSSSALAETKLFFTKIFMRYLQHFHEIAEMKAVNETLDALIHDLVRLENKAQQNSTHTPVPEPNSTLAFIQAKVALLSDTERREFLNAQRGKRAPKFVKRWREELPFKVSDGTWANSLSDARNSLLKEKNA